jgi:hypothetical protein
MTNNQNAGKQAATPVHVSVEYRRPATRRHRARYIVHCQGKAVPVIPKKSWEHAEAYILAAAKVTGIAPEEFGTDYFYRAVGWRWFTTAAGASKNLPLAQRGLGVPRP